MTKIMQANVTLPATTGEVFTTALEEVLDVFGPRVKLVVFSHISSVPALIEPVVELTKMVKQYNPKAAVMVDGAHALGHLDVNIPDLAAAGVDFWLGNGHKWLFSPKGSCVLWVSEEHRDWSSRHGVVPNIISVLSDDFEKEFADTGTKDYTPYLAMKDALEFRQSLGGDSKILPYIRDLAWQGGQLLSQLFGGTATMATESLTSAMVDVQLPATTDPTKFSNLTTALLDQHDAFVVAYQYSLPDGTDLGYWIRVSAQVYLDMKSFEDLGTWILDLI